MRPSRSTSATSPRRAAPSSVPMIVRSVSPPSEASRPLTLPALEVHDEVAHDRPVDQHERLGSTSTVPCVRSGSGVVNTSSVGQVGHVLDPVDGLEARGLPARGGQQADRQVGSRAVVVQRVEAALGEPFGGAHERVGARAPDGDRVLLVEPQHVQQLALEPLQPLARFELGEDEVGPDLRRARADRPVDRAVVDDLDALLDRRQQVLADQRRIEVGQQARRGRPRQCDVRAALVAERQHALAVPRPARSRASPAARARSARA